MNKIKRSFLNTLILGYLSVIYFSGVPESNTLNSRIKEMTRDLSYIFGIWPSWSMFAPNPIKFDSKTYVEINYNDGEIKVEDVEKSLEGPLAVFRKARWMKFAQDNLRSERQKNLRIPTVDYFYKMYNTKQRPVSHIKLVRKWLDVPPIGIESKLVPILHNEQLTAHSEVLFEMDFKE